MKENRVKKLNQHAAIINAPAPDGKIHRYFIDADKYRQASKYTWHSRLRANNTYEAAAFQKGGDTLTPITLHRLLAGAKPGQQVAFKDGNTRNCRAENLRVYESVGERVKDYFTCQVPLQGAKSNVPVAYETKHGERYLALFKNGGQTKTKGGFESIKAAQEWVLSEKAALCTCGDEV